MVVKKGVRVGTEFGEGEVVAVTKEFVVVDIAGLRGEVACHKDDSPVWVVPTSYEISGGDDSFEIADESASP